MPDDLRPPYRVAFDHARDPYTARNALGITGTGGGAPDDAQYIVATADATLTAERVLTDTATVTWDFSTAGQAKASTTAAASPPQGRLTLQTVTPVMTATQSAKTTVFYTPYVGNKAPIYDGSSMVMTTFAELSNVTTASSTGSAGPAAVAASSVYDLFIWSNGGTVTLTRGPVWTNATTRSAGTALVMVNGILLNNAAITNGPAAQRGTYIGTVRSNASSQLDWILGSGAAGGGAAHLNVWNAYNRRSLVTFVRDTTSSWSVTSTTAVSVNGSSNNRVSFVCGLQEDCLSAEYTTNTDQPPGIFLFVDLALDGTGTSLLLKSYSASNTNAGVIYFSQPFGYHYLQAQEYIIGAGSCTVYGPSYTGITFSFDM